MNPLLFASTEAHPKMVKLPDGSEEEFYFRELPAVEMRRQHLAETSADPDVRDNAIARLIAVGLCDVNGKPVLSVEQAAALKSSVAGQMVTHIMAVSGFGGSSPGNA